MINSPYGSLKNLFEMIKLAPMLQPSAVYPQGVSLVWGEENIKAQEFPTPMVAFVSVGSDGFQPGYYKRRTNGVGPMEPADVDSFNSWIFSEDIDLYCWGFDPDINAQEIDHVDATEDLAARMLQAFQDSQIRYVNNGFDFAGGLMWRPKHRRWQLFNNANLRFGRGLVLRVQVDITVPDVPVPEATVKKITIVPTLTEEI